jgi:hypothetical protein
MLVKFDSQVGTLTMFGEVVATTACSRPTARIGRR